VARLFDDHADAIYAYAVRRVGEHDAADVLSETFVIALQGFARFDPALGTPRGWLFGIANNVLRHHWRTEARRLRRLDAQRLPLLVGDPLLAVDARMDAQQAAAPVVDALLAADPDERDLILMWAWEQLSYADIATAMNLPIGTVRSRLHRARKRLEPFRPKGAT
jgi:RNA polymerase sigma factor (sigma-70 family)